MSEATTIPKSSSSSPTASRSRKKRDRGGRKTESIHDLFFFDGVNPNDALIIESVQKSEHPSSKTNACIYPQYWFTETKKIFGCQQCPEHPFCRVCLERYTPAILEDKTSGLTENQRLAKKTIREYDL